MSDNKKIPDRMSGARAPRYTSYPTAVHFHAGVGADFHFNALATLPADEPISVYIHIPFCERLCWFCACRTQGTKTPEPVARYLDVLLAEIAHVAALLPKGIRIGRLHWGGGTPTILSPDQMTRLAEELRRHFGFVEDAEFSVEIDPTLIDRHKIEALARSGMTRASIGIQDFSPQVQRAIGREQTYNQTAECVAQLRKSGITSLNADIVYGLPHQTTRSVLQSLDQVLSLAPDRIALFGYAHVPWMAKRQRLIDAAALPAADLRLELFARMSERIQSRGFTVLGIDHFARPGDSLAVAGESGRLRRNFQGYTDDRCAALIGFGASAISRFPQGYVQNAAATSAYLKNISDGALATARGYCLTDEDRLRARVIEMIMCDFRLDLAALAAEFGDAVKTVAQDCRRAMEKFAPRVVFDGAIMTITPAGRPATRLIAMEFDRKTLDRSRHSLAS